MNVGQVLLTKSISLVRGASRTRGIATEVGKVSELVTKEVRLPHSQGVLLPGCTMPAMHNPPDKLTLSVAGSLEEGLRRQGFESLEVAQGYVDRIERMNQLADEFYQCHSDARGKEIQARIGKHILDSAKNGRVELPLDLGKDGRPIRHSDRIVAAYCTKARELGYGVSVTRNPDSDIFIIGLHPGKVKNMHPDIYRQVLKTLEPELTPKDLLKVGVKDLHFKQHAIGDCYFLSSIYALSRHPKGQEILSKMIIPRSNGSFRVIFPGYPDIPITVTRAEVREFKEMGIKEGPEGLKILERAYSELRRHIDNDVVNFSREGALNGGFGHRALRHLTGGESKSLSSHGEVFAKHSDIAITAEKLLNQLAREPENLVVTAGTPSRGPYKVERINAQGGDEFSNKYIYFMDSEHRFFCNHSYAVVGVNPQARKVTVVNPHDTQTQIYTLSYEKFMQIFDCIEGVRLNGKGVKKGLILLKNS